jgi:hypothetical protein
MLDSQRNKDKKVIIIGSGQFFENDKICDP